MKSKAILMALLALAFGGVEAASITTEQATRAARAWAARGRVLGARMGRTVKKTTRFSFTTNATEYAFYSVKMEGGGTVFVSSDDESEPIIAFTSSTNDYSTIDRRSPLWALLSRDAVVRGNIRNRRRQQPTSSAVRATSAAKWQTLLTKATKVPKLMAADRYTDDEFTADPTVIDDMRVMPLLSTKWSQTTHDDEPNEALGEYFNRAKGYMDVATGKNCYNYYTPGFAVTYPLDMFGEDTKTITANAPCGCTATATSQIMRYFRWPVDSVAAQSFTCTVGEKSTTLTMRGGVYDWDLMSDVPSTDLFLTEANCEAIGHLTYDVGVALKSDYSASGTGADPRSVATAMTGALGYANARTYWSQDVFSDGASAEGGKVTVKAGLHTEEVREQVIYANLDARKPVLFAIYGYSTSGSWGGHAVVGDGYGFATIKDDEGIVTNSTAYVHVNLGWSGADDAWYNLPEIHAVETGASGADEGFNFTILAGAAYNIFPDETGEIISGRVFDENGDIAPGAIVRIPALGLKAVADEKGIYSFIVPAGKNSYQLETDARRGNYDDAISAKITSYSGGRAGNNYTDVGNVWGADLKLALSPFADSIEIVRSGSSLPGKYGTLDAALADARDGDTINILRPTVMKDAVCLISNKVTLAWAPTGDIDAYTNGVFSCNAGAKIRILDGGRLEIGDYVYLPKALTAIEAAETGVFAVSGDVRVPEVRTEGELCFELMGEIATNIVLQAHSLARYVRIGTAHCLPEVVTNCAPFLVNPADMYMCVACSNAVDGLALIWDLEDTPDDNRDATLDVGRGPVNYRNLDRLLQDVEPGTTVTVYRDCSLSKALDLTGDLILTSAVDAVQVEVKNTAGFHVGEGASLSIYGLTFTGFGGKKVPFVMVDGDDAGVGGDLYLGAGTMFYEMTGSVPQASGIVTVLKGRVVVDGAAFEKCQSLGEDAKGGAIFLDGLGCSLELRDATIWKCRAVSFGGGIYAGRQTELSLAGEVSVIGNVRNWSQPDNYDDAVNYYPNMSATDNIYVCAPKMTKVRIVEPLTSQPKNIGLRFSSNGDGFGNPKSSSILKCAVFADATIDESLKAQSAACFISDADTMYRGVLTSDGAAVQWKSTEGAAEDITTAWTRVIYPKTAETNYYDSIDKAFAFLRSGVEAIIEPLRDEDEIRLRGYYYGEPVYDWFNYNAITKPVTITQPVTIRSAWDQPEKANGVYRFSGDTMNIRVLDGGALTVTNVCMNGHYHYFYQDVYFGMIVDLDAWVGGPLALVEVKGGELFLKNGAEFAGSDVETDGCRASGAIAVWDNGRMTMEPGSLIHGFKNGYIDEVEGVGVGSGITVDNGIAYLKGGEISGCAAYKNAGVFIGNEAKVYVSGDMKIVDNVDLAGNPSNLAVQDLSQLYLADTLSGGSGVTDGFMAETNVFGCVAADCPASDDEQVASAKRFCRDSDASVTGLVVTNSDARLLVWSTAVKTESASGSRYYEVAENGETMRFYELKSESPEPPPGPGPEPEPEPQYATPKPIAFTAISRVDDTVTLEFTNAVQWCWYNVFATNALQGGFALTNAAGQAITVPVTNFQWKLSEETIKLTLPVVEGHGFWRVTAEKGEIPTE